MSHKSGNLTPVQSNTEDGIVSPQNTDSPVVPRGLARSASSPTLNIITENENETSGSESDASTVVETSKSPATAERDLKGNLKGQNQVPASSSHNLAPTIRHANEALHEVEDKSNEAKGKSSTSFAPISNAHSCASQGISRSSTPSEEVCSLLSIETSRSSARPDAPSSAFIDTAHVYSSIEEIRSSAQMMADILKCVKCATLVKTCHQTTCGHWICEHCSVDLFADRARSVKCPACDHRLAKYRSFKYNERIAALANHVRELLDFCIHGISDDQNDLDVMSVTTNESEPQSKLNNIVTEDQASPVKQTRTKILLPLNIKNLLSSVKSVRSSTSLSDDGYATATADKRTFVTAIADKCYNVNEKDNRGTVYSPIPKDCEKKNNLLVFQDSELFKRTFGSHQVRQDITVNVLNHYYRNCLEILTKRPFHDQMMSFTAVIPTHELVKLLQIAQDSELGPDSESYAPASLMYEHSTSDPNDHAYAPITLPALQDALHLATAQENALHQQQHNLAHGNVHQASASHANHSLSPPQPSHPVPHVAQSMSAPNPPANLVGHYPQQQMIPSPTDPSNRIFEKKIQDLAKVRSKFSKGSTHEFVVWFQNFRNIADVSNIHGFWRVQLFYMLLEGNALATLHTHAKHKAESNGLASWLNLSWEEVSELAHKYLGGLHRNKMVNAGIAGSIVQGPNQSVAAYYNLKLAQILAATPNITTAELNERIFIGLRPEIRRHYTRTLGDDDQFYDKIVECEEHELGMLVGKVQTKSQANATPNSQTTPNRGRKNWRNKKQPQSQETPQQEVTPTSAAIAAAPTGPQPDNTYVSYDPTQFTPRQVQYTHQRGGGNGNNRGNGGNSNRGNGRGRGRGKGNYQQGSGQEYGNFSNQQSENRTANTDPKAAGGSAPAADNSKN